MPRDCGEIGLLYRGFIISRFCGIHFKVTLAGLFKLQHCLLYQERHNIRGSTVHSEIFILSLGLTRGGPEYFIPKFFFFNVVGSVP